MSDVKLGVLCWNQYTDWPSLLAAGQRADRLGFDTLWTWDHLYPIQGSSSGPMFEGWLTLAAWAQATERIRIGLMVGANPFREPTLTAKMATTLDHISGGRAILGIGAAWFEEEHEAFGIEFGSGPPERLRWLGEALPIMRGMLHGERPTASGPRYTAKTYATIQPLSSSTCRCSSVVVASRSRSSWWRATPTPTTSAGGWRACAARKPCCSSIAKPLDATRPRSSGRPNIGTVVIRDSRDEARRVHAEMFARNGNARQWTDQPVGTPEDVAEMLLPFLGIGYRHLVFGFPSPYDEESMTRLATDVRPILERA